MMPPKSTEEFIIEVMAVLVIIGICYGLYLIFGQ